MKITNSNSQPHLPPTILLSTTPSTIYETTIYITLYKLIIKSVHNSNYEGISLRSNNIQIIEVKSAYKVKEIGK